LGDGLNVFIVSNDPRLAAHAASSPFGVIEYNGHDAFEFGAVGQVYIRRMSEREKMEERVWVNG
jgi:mannitol/fructose-specific phosphotransferase system IIA component